MSDAQLAALLEDCWQRHDAAKSRGGCTLQYSARGPIRHPSAYAISSILSYDWQMGEGIGVAFWVGLKSSVLPGLRTVMQMHLAFCDIADITEEFQRRAKRRGRVT